MTITNIVLTLVVLLVAGYAMYYIIKNCFINHIMIT